MVERKYEERWATSITFEKSVYFGVNELLPKGVTIPDILNGFLKQHLEQLQAKNMIAQSFEDKSAIKTRTDISNKTNLFVPEWITDENRQEERDEYQDSMKPRDQFLFMKNVKNWMDRFEQRYQELEPERPVSKKRVDITREMREKVAYWVLHHMEGSLSNEDKETLWLVREANRRKTSIIEVEVEVN
jgi:hypothetical protein